MSALIGRRSIALLLLAAACGGRPSDTALRAGTDSAGTRPLRDWPPVTVELKPVGNSAISGRVVFSPGSDSDTKVAITLTGGPSEPRHPAHIHFGQCGSFADVAAVLPSVSPQGAARGVVTLSLPQLTDGRHVVIIHTAAGPPGTAVACGAISASPSSGQSPATGPVP